MRQRVINVAFSCLGWWDRKWSTLLSAVLANETESDQRCFQLSWLMRQSWVAWDAAVYINCVCLLYMSLTVSVCLCDCLCVSLWLSLCFYIGLWGRAAGKCRRFHPTVSCKLRDSARWAWSYCIWWSETTNCDCTSAAQEPVHSDTWWSHQVHWLRDFTRYTDYVISPRTLTMWFHRVHWLRDFTAYTSRLTHL